VTAERMMRRKVAQRMMGRKVAQGMMGRQVVSAWRWRRLLRDSVAGEARGERGRDDKGLDHRRYSSPRRA
jgi:hypothetical protein